MKVAIATDTNSSMTGREAARKGVYLLPMPVMVDGRACLEGVDITNEQLYAAMKEHKEVFSSQPSPGQLLDFWQGIFRDGWDEVVYIPMSSGLSNSCSTAVQLAGTCGGKVYVVDNHRISLTQAASVDSALALAGAGSIPRHSRFLCAPALQHCLPCGHQRGGHRHPEKRGGVNRPPAKPKQKAAPAGVPLFCMAAK